jgi:hypothetical protein
LKESEREHLEQLVNRHTTEQQIVLRAKIILLAEQGQNHRAIARELDISRKMAMLQYLSVKKFKGAWLTEFQEFQPYHSPQFK